MEEDIFELAKVLSGVSKQSSTNITSAETTGMDIGPYRLVEAIGKGGFGMVFRAEQTEPIRRDVAVKVLKPGMDSDAILARFEAEKQALALMDHDGIAKIFDAGMAPSGRPFFAMELVDGVPINKFCAENELKVRERVELFTKVCNAVEHAHQKGIIHRDLKPSNILVSGNDGEIGIKVIDFGIAKAIGFKLTDQTLTSPIGQVIGTPQYMSPEQADFSALDVDTRSDIYSLGAILYELLTARTPLDPDRLRTAGYAEMERMIREEDAIRPSQRVTEALATAGTTPNSREIRSRKSELENDLDWITLKALEKDRERRYPSVALLAEDISRHLRDQPVLASPPNRVYRLRKFVRRNSAATAVAATVVLGATTALGLLVSERAATRDRNAALGRLNESLINSRAQAAVMAAQRGDWEQQLRELDSALEYGNPDRLQLRLSKIQALVALNRVAEARAELDSIKAEGGDFGRHRGRVLLWEAEFALSGRGSDIARARAFVNEAIAAGFSDSADLPYATGLLAENSQAAIDHFGRALQCDPFHHAASMRTTRLLILLGRFEEAERHLFFIRKAFPDETAHSVLSAMIAAFGGEPDLASSLMADSQLAKMDKHVAGEMIAAWSELGDAISNEWDTGNPLGAVDAISKAKVFSGKAWAVQSNVGGGRESLFLFDDLSMSHSFGAVQSALKAALFGVFGMPKAISRLEDASERHPECMVTFLHGLVSFAYAIRLEQLGAAQEMVLKHSRGAIRAFERASIQASIVPDLPKEAMFAAGMVNLGLWLEDRENRRLRDHMLACFSKRMAMGGPIKDRHLGYISRAANKAKDDDLSRLAQNLRLEKNPDDTEAVALLAETEERCGNFVLSLKLARRALDLGVEGARKSRLEALVDRCLEEIRELARSEPNS